MTASNIRKICFGGSCVSVESDSPKGQELIEFLFRDTSRNSDIVPHVAFSLSANGSNDTLNCYKDGELVNESVSLGATGRYLMDQVIYHLTDQCRDGLVFHAAALSNGKHCFILPGESGAGKSTLTAWLLKNGFNYITDELVFVGNRAAHIEGFPRPLNIKTPGVPVVKKFIDLSDSKIEPYISDISTLIPHRLLNENFTIGDNELRAIIFLEYKANAQLSLVPITRAQTGMRLVSLLVNARNLSDHGFPEIGRISKTIQGYQMQYGGFDDIVDIVNNCLSNPEIDATLN